MSSHIQGTPFDINVLRFCKAVVIDSRFRDRRQYPNNHTYSYSVGAFRQIATVQLERVIIPATSYLINSSNNVLSFTYDDVLRSVQVPPGDYSATELVAELEGLIQHACGLPDDPPEDTIQLSINDLTNRLSIVVPDVDPVPVLTLHYATSNIASVLGFYEDISNGANRTLVLPGALLIRRDDYVILHLGGMERCDGSAARSAFCIIPLTSQGYIFDSGSSTAQFRFSSSLPRFERVDVKITRPDGSPYEASSGENLIVLNLIRDP